MNYREDAFTFRCLNDSLVGILASPENPASTTGVLIIVGGPQYRVGSHRQFVEFSRALAETGYPCMRFDYRGMGDSSGTQRAFEKVDEDIAAAINTLLQKCPGLNDVVLWGLCDGATAAAFYSARDSRINGLILINPWVHTDEAEAQVYLKYYYFRRITSRAFWRKIMDGQFELKRALKDLKRLVEKAAGGRRNKPNAGTNNLSSLPQRLASSLMARQQKRLVILSEQDYVAKEFQALIDNDTQWQDILSDTPVVTIRGADHTFSTPNSAQAVTRQTISWIGTLKG